MASGSRALITGIGGQDGSLLAPLLAGRGYEVVGTVLNAAEPSEGAEVLELDLDDFASVRAAVRKLRPDEIYHLASESFVPAWWEDPVGNARSAATSVAGLLEATRTEAPEARFLFASSAEMFGAPEREPQDEETSIRPLTPYGAAKAFGHFLTQSFRRKHGLHASSAILFNHESPRRPERFLTRKVSRGAAAISLKLEEELLLGDLSARRDWGYAGEYVQAMWLMLQADQPDDYVIATGEAHSAEEFVAKAFEHVGLNWRNHVRFDESLLRGASDAPALVGDPTKIKERLGWEPEVRFHDLVGILVDADVAALRAQAAAAR